VSATAATVIPLTSVPSTSPLLMRNTRIALQRSFVAPSDSDAVQGQTTSHEHVSKYEPSSFQAISPPRAVWDAADDIVEPPRGGRPTVRLQVPRSLPDEA
jgi:hypothetical protein